jgi:hypothetical protein
MVAAAETMKMEHQTKGPRGREVACAIIYLVNHVGAECNLTFSVYNISSLLPYLNTEAPH